MIMDIGFVRDIVGGNECYLQGIRRKCITAKKKNLENKIMDTDILKCVRYLLNNSDPQNDDTVQYLLDPRIFKPC
jgi:hypothetical protein